MQFFYQIVDSLNKNDQNTIQSYFGHKWRFVYGKRLL